MSTSSRPGLSPAFPDRAAWGSTPQNRSLRSRLRGDPARTTAAKLRAWQAEALEKYLVEQPRDFLAVATPGAGKTTFALRLANELLASRQVHAITVVTPTEHLKRQWAQAAARVGIRLDAGFRNAQGSTSRDYVGVTVTYAGVGAHPALHRNRTQERKSLVILDEIHHAADAQSWGEAVREAFDPASRRLALTGTPFRSDTNPIPFVGYAPGEDGIPRSVADYSYGYGQALRDSVVRPVIFLAYSGQMRWRTSAGDEVAAQLGEPATRQLTAHAWRTALDPSGDWIPAVLEAADRRLSEVRRHMPDAAGLVIASDHEAARAYAKLLRRVSGAAPALVLSDEPAASKRIEEFAGSDRRWMVAVRMVSEGVDIPRLAVGVYATSVSTPLYFAQAVGRFVRARRRGETASVFLPTIPGLLEFAAELEVERDHVLGRTGGSGDEDDPFAAEDALLARAEQTQTEPGAQDAGFEALGSDAHFDRVLYDGGEFGLQAAVGSAEEQDYLGLPGLLEPDQVAELLQRRQAEQLAAQRRADRVGRVGRASRGAVAEPDPVDSLPALRKELNGLVGAWHHRTGQSHGAIHAELRRVCGGPPAAQAGAAQLAERIALIRQWALRRQT
ncbi:MAG: DEAD/DEAH box helicase [Sporichthyaceae bacterium]|nr:DEAD/DEAH box helicase [Sporichthyaceae bacterium]